MNGEEALVLQPTVALLEGLVYLRSALNILP